MFRNLVLIGLLALACVVSTPSATPTPEPVKREAVGAIKLGGFCYLTDDEDSSLLYLVPCSYLSPVLKEEEIKAYLMLCFLDKLQCKRRIN